MPCTCGSNFIENKKYNMCPTCNYFRLHGKSQNEVYSERKKVRDTQKAQSEPKVRTKPISSIPKVRKPVILTKKAKEERNIKSKLSALKKEIRQEAIDNDTYFCKGCLKSSENLDCSHSLSVGLWKKYELVKENILLLCRKCHLLFESRQKEKLLQLHCLDEILQFIKSVEPNEYNKYIEKLK